MPHQIFFKKRPQSGFTLIEILVSVAIISLIGIVFFPNLRGFNSGQQYQNDVLNLKNLIKEAQSNSANGTKCTSTEPAVSWSVLITPGTSTVTTSAALQANCFTSSQTIVPRTLNTGLYANTSVPSSNCATGNKIELKFDKTGFSYACNGGSTFTQISTSIQLQNKSNTSQSTTIIINTAGIVSQN